MVDAGAVPLVEDEDDEDAPESELAAAAGLSADAAVLPAGADVPPLPLRKSVTYQPVPLS